MNWQKRYILTLYLIFQALVGLGQNFCVDNFSDQYYAVPDSIIALEISIDNKLSEQEYELIKNGYKQFIYFNKLSKPINFCYLYLKKNTSLVGPSLNTQLYDSTVRYSTQKEVENAQHSTQEFLGLEGIQIEGAFLRSVSGGQQTSVRTHSALDLQMRGQISDELRLEANLTDQQMPFEPDGNTQRLQDFDRVNIKLIHHNWTLEGGDMLVKDNTRSTFLNYQRQVQGVGIATNKLSIDSANSYSRAVTSISKSKVGIQRISPIEGVLGPYRIEGPQNEPFIFILSGSEKVYLDGQLLKRGVGYDYVIDYNAAEISFNANVYISKFSQIVVEYEYSDQEFARAVSSINHYQDVGRWKFSVNYFQEGDNINRPLTELSIDDKNKIAETDQSQGFAYIDAVDSVTNYFPGQVLYESFDTLVNGKVFSIYKYTADEDKAIYQISFSMVGEGNGNYIVKSSNTNRQVFEWVAPVNGISQGNYAPVRKIILPQKKRVIEIGAAYAFKNKDEISIQYAASKYVGNRFNPTEATTNGMAVGVTYKGSNKALFSLQNWTWNYTIKLEKVDSSFVPIQNFRDLSYNRDWGIDQSGRYLNAEEYFYGQSLSVQSLKQKISYDLAFRKRGESPTGIQQKISYNHRGDFNVNASLYNMDNQLGDTQINWKRARFDLNYNKLFVVPGYTFDFEKHELSKQDSIKGSFQHFDQHTVYLRSADSAQFKFQLAQIFRKDYTPSNGEFILFEASQTTRAETSIVYGSANFIGATFTKKHIQKSLNEEELKDFYQANFNWRQYFWNGTLQQEINYGTGTGRVLERSYYFQEVALGLGTHSWSDLNDNGVQELEEFFEDETTYGNRNFVKLYNFTNEYRTAFTNSLKYKLLLKFPAEWRNAGFLLSQLSKLSSSLHYQLEDKNTAASWSERLNMFNTATGEESLLYRKEYLRTQLFINRGAKLNATLNWQQNDRKQLLLNGFEGGKHQAFTFIGVWNLMNDWSVSSQYDHQIKSQFSDLVAPKNYSFKVQGFSPTLSWQHYSKWRLSTSYNYTLKNTLNSEDPINILIQKLDFRSKWIQSNKGMLEAHFGLVKVENDLSTEINSTSAVLYDMYEGLNKGDNYVWDISLRRKIIGDLNLSLSYNGRKAAERPTVQYGSVQLSALF